MRLSLSTLSALCALQVYGVYADVACIVSIRIRRHVLSGKDADLIHSRPDVQTVRWQDMPTSTAVALLKLNVSARVPTSSLP